MGDLTTVAAVKAYATITSNNVDTLIGTFITTESAVIERYCNRSFSVQTKTQRFSGSGGSSQWFPGAPIVSIQSLSIDGVTIPASDGQSVGYLFDPADDNGMVYLKGSVFTRCPMNVLASWTYGYAAVPAAVAQACVEMVALDLAQRSNIGITSKTLATETVVYADTGMTKSAMQQVALYRQMVPV